MQGNLLTTAAGFLLASQKHIKPGLLAATLAGTALIIASACVVNNYLDRNIDRQMARTRQRALVAGDIGVVAALGYAAVLGVAGLAILVAYVNLLTAGIGLFGWLAYVGLYSFMKRRSVHGTLAGTISGATPPVAGYTAVTGRLDGAALLLFLILVCWQMAHFFSIAIYRFKDYKAAGLPVLPVVKGVGRAKRAIFLYASAFTAAALLLTVFGYTGGAYAVVVGLASIWWLQKAIQGPRTRDDTAWARQMFLRSLVVILIFSVSLAASPWLA